MLTLAVIVIGLVFGTSLSPESIAALITAVVGAIATVSGAAYVWKNRKRDDEGQAVQAATGIFDAYKGLVDDLRRAVADLERTVARLVQERDIAQAAYERACHELADSPEKILALKTERDDLKAKLAASIEQLHTLVAQAQDAADDIKDVADEAEEAANGG